MRDPDKPQQIIEAAVRVFARKGYFNSRVSDIAREAGIAAGTIYLYFKTKEDILITLFREKMADVRGVRCARAIADEPDAVAKVRRLVQLHFAHAGGGSGPRRGGAGRAAPGPEVLPRRLRARRSRAYFALIGSVLEEGVGRGALPLRPAVKVATKMLFGAMDQMATSWVLGKRGYRLVDTAPAPWPICSCRALPPPHHPIGDRRWRTRP